MGSYSELYIGEYAAHCVMRLFMEVCPDQEPILQDFSDLVYAGYFHKTNKGF